MVVINGQQLYASWLRWWSSINPTWRECKNDRLVAGGSGDWSAMWSATGKNGMVNVIACLQALRDVTTHDKWAAEVADVRWAMEQVLAAKRARG